MKKRFAVFDIDGTLIRWQLYHATADTLVRLGHFDTDQYKSIKAARMAWKRRENDDSFKAYERQLVAIYQKSLLNLTQEQFDEAAKLVFEEYRDQVYTYTRDLIKDLKAKGYLLFAISGSQADIVSSIAGYYGFDDYIGTEYERHEGRFTGNNTLHAGSKHIILDKLVKKHGASYEGSIAVGDSEGDISMLEAVENPIAFNPTKKLLAMATQSNWSVIIERKNVVYKLEPRDGSYILA